MCRCSSRPAATAPTVAADEVVARCRKLARISEERGRLTRPFGGPAMLRANELVGRWMEEAGMAGASTPRATSSGTCRARSRTPGRCCSARTSTRCATPVRSTARSGSRVAIAASQRLRARGGRAAVRARRHRLLRRGGAALRHRVPRQPRRWPGADDVALDLRDADGVSVAEALRAFGGIPDHIERASRPNERLLGYLEVHIEQGPVLEERGRAARGCRPRSAGATRPGVTFIGRAGPCRHGADGPAPRRAGDGGGLVLTVEARGRSGDGLVATVGRIEAFPGAPNVVPGRGR